MRTERVDGAGFPTQHVVWQGWDTSHIDEMAARQDAGRRVAAKSLHNAEKGVRRVLVTHTIVPTPPEEVRRIVRECGS